MEPTTTPGVMWMKKLLLVAFALTFSLEAYAWEPLVCFPTRLDIVQYQPAQATIPSLQGEFDQYGGRDCPPVLITGPVWSVTRNGVEIASHYDSSGRLRFSTAMHGLFVVTVDSTVRMSGSKAKRFHDEVRFLRY